MKRLLYFLLIVVSFFSCSTSDEPETEKPQPETTELTKGVWVTNVASQALASKDNIIETVANCEKSGLNTIYMVVWNKGYTLYQSQVMKEHFGVSIFPGYENWDPLMVMIEEAHKKNIKVYAWFEYGFACSFGTNGGHIIKKYPDWASKDQNNNLLNKNGFEWMNPFYPEVQDFMLDLISEVVEKYDVDGIQGDDRMPALPIEGGYDAYTKELFKNENGGADVPLNAKDPAWIQWRADKLSQFQSRLYQAVKKIKAHVKVTNAPSVHPWAKENYLQDWPEWLEKGYTDHVSPQHYRKDIDSYKQTLQQQLSFVKSQDRKKFSPGLLIQNGSENPAESFLIKMIKENRYNGIKNESFWFYEGLNKFPVFFRDYKSGKYN